MATTKRKTKTPPVTTPSTPAAPLPTPKTTTLQDKIVLLTMHIRAPGNHRAVRNKAILDTQADKKRLSISKRLIVAPEHKFIETLDGEIREYVHTMALPFPFSAGTYALPLELFQEVDATLLDFNEKRLVGVETLKAAYGEAKERAKDALGDLYRESDYLSPSQIDEAYTLKWQYLTLAAPDQLRNLDSSIFQREQALLQQQWTDAAVEMKDAMRVGLAALVDDMVERLKNAGDDKRFKPSALLERFTAFLANFNARNITGDAQLEALAEQARGVLKGVNTFSLTQRKDVRAAVEQGFKAVQTTLNTLEVEARGRRKFNFDGEE